MKKKIKFDEIALKNAYSEILAKLKESGELGVWGSKGKINDIKDELEHFLSDFIAPALALACKHYADNYKSFMVNK